jgi:hypothetical protein
LRRYDLAGNAVSNPLICGGFGSLLTSSQPGWLFFDNMVATPTAFTAELVGVGSGKYCSPRHQTHFEPLFLELKGIL